jgi:hypothetical protein
MENGKRHAMTFKRAFTAQKIVIIRRLPPALLTGSDSAAWAGDGAQASRSTPPLMPLALIDRMARCGQHA